MILKVLISGVSSGAPNNIIPGNFMLVFSLLKEYILPFLGFGNPSVFLV